MAADFGGRPHLTDAARQIAERWTVLHGAIESLERLGPLELDRAERTLASLRRMFPDDRAWSAALDAVGEFTVAYLREQVAYASSGEYARATFEEAARDVYLDAGLMKAMYLPGLYLTQVFWPVHVKIGSIFEDEFLATLPAAGSIVEVGVGHGWTFTRLLVERPGISAAGFDFSPSSLEFTAALASAQGVPRGRYRLASGDVQKGLDFPTGGADFLVSGEVLEHVQNPEVAAAEFRRVLRAGGRAFVTTCIDSPMLDHISNWPSPEAVDEMLGRAGLSVEKRFVLRPADLATRKTRFVDTTKNYVAVLRAV